MIQTDLKDLDRHLKALFVCYGSPLDWAADVLARSVRFRLRMEIAGRDNPGYSLFIDVAKRLGVEYDQVEIPPLMSERPLSWVTDRNALNQRAWIPPMRHRGGDFCRLLPFYLRYHLTELRKHEPGYPEPILNSLYIILLQAECFGILPNSLCTRVLQDLLAWEKAHRLPILKHGFRGLSEDETRTVNNRVSEMSDLSQLYLGFGSGGEGWKLLEGSELKEHPFNPRTRRVLTAIQPGGGAPRLPVLIRQHSWNISQIAVAMRNAWLLEYAAGQNDPEEVEKTRRCLVLRLQGATEAMIQGELAFADLESYEKWQLRRYIYTLPAESDEAHEKWLQACDYFGIEPDLRMLEADRGPRAAGGRQSSAASDARVPGQTEGTGQEKPVDGFRHSPDYRSVISADGQRLSLTPRQAEVIRILHEAYEAGTPDVPQGRIVEEVYGQIRENRLKKNFRDNKVWSALVQPGGRRDLVRLKVAPVKDS